MTTKTIVFIHGMYMTPLCWENWMKRFQATGYVVHAPAWPGRGRPVDALRKAHPDVQLGKLTLSQVVNHLAAYIQALGEKPILIGHSMGGHGADTHASFSVRAPGFGKQQLQLQIRPNVATATLTLGRAHIVERARTWRPATIARRSPRRWRCAR